MVSATLHPEMMAKTRYRLLTELGVGFYTRVLRAHDTEGHGDVAVKMLNPAYRSDRELRARLLREGSSLARIQHPNVMPVLDVVTEPDPLYAMPILEGKLLSTYRKRGPAPASVLRAVGKELSDALAAIHSVGLVHRDLRPENVMVVGRRCVVFDLGVAMDLAGVDTLTNTGRMFSQPEYAAPELLRGRPATPATDLYALGLVLLELALGRHPFGSTDTRRVVAQQLWGTPPSLAEERPELPRKLDTLLRALLAKEPEERPASALGVSFDVARILAG